MMTEREAREARRLREAHPERWPRTKLAARYNVDVAIFDRVMMRLSVILDRANDKRRRRDSSSARKSPIRSEADLRREILAAAAASEERDFTATFFGDPPSGRSAYDRMLTQAVGAAPGEILFLPRCLTGPDIQRVQLPLPEQARTLHGRPKAED
jgi:hypothetical protein